MYVPFALFLLHFLPPFPAEERVLEHHLVTARVMLDEHGIAEPTLFAAKLQKAG
jgi:hypothetical protein